MQLFLSNLLRGENSYYFNSDIYRGLNINWTQHHWYNSFVHGHQSWQPCMRLHNFLHVNLQFRCWSPVVFGVCQDWVNWFI